MPFPTNAVLLLLKATTTKTITVPAYTNKHGHMVAAHTKVVHFDPNKEDHHVLSGNGSYSQKKAHEKLSKLANWSLLPAHEQMAHVLSSATNIQKTASQQAAVSTWKKLAFAGENPKKAIWAIRSSVAEIICQKPSG